MILCGVWIVTAAPEGVRTSALHDFLQQSFPGGLRSVNPYRPGLYVL